MNVLSVPSKVGSVIGGSVRLTERQTDITNPATGEPIAQLCLASTALADEAVEAAQQAFLGWRDTAPAQRARILRRFLGFVEADRDHLARLIVLEHGKPLADALGSIGRGLEVVEFAIGAPHLLKGENSDHVATGITSRSAKRPLGVCLGITPFNYPAMIPMWMFPMALACGNTFVLKPSEKAPSAANRLAELLQEAGLPDGAFNVVHGDHTIAGHLVEHPGISSVSFVGSTPVARKVYEAATRSGKRAQALGGAKNHAIVMPDAAMDMAADAIMNGAFNSAGQRCMAISVAVCVGDAYDKMLPLLLERAPQLKVADGFAPDCYVPPMANRQQYEKVLGYIDRAVAEGANLRLDGRSTGAEMKGFFIGPTIFEDVTTEMKIYTEEVFGPVLVLLRAPDLQAAIDQSNSHPLANGAVLFTSSGAAAHTFEKQILCGMPGVNVPVPSPVAYHSFGGNKASFYGDLAMHGPDAINFYTRRQVMTTRWP